MSFASGETGIERGAVKLVFDFAPTVLKRYAHAGLRRALEVSIANTPIVTEYGEAQDAPTLEILVPYLSSTQITTLLSLAGAAGPVSVKTNPTGTTGISAAFVSVEIQHATEQDFPDDVNLTYFDGFKAVIVFALL